MQTNCQYPGCDKKKIAKGFCHAHYRRILRNNTLELKNRMGVVACQSCGVTGIRFRLGMCNKCYIREYRKNIKNKKILLARKERKNNKNYNTKKLNPICYQYQKRLDWAEIEKDNPYWLDYDLDLKKSKIERISVNQAKELIVKYEYLGKMSTINQYCYGLFFPHKIEQDKWIMAGAVVFGAEYSESLGRWDKYGYTGRILLLNRGVCLHYAPKNSNSKLIMGAIKLLPKNIDVVTATTDPEAGEVGTIYQSCNFYYVGQMRQQKERMAMVMSDGQKFTSISLLRKYGTISKSKLRELFPDAQFTTVANKHRYFWFRNKKDVDGIRHLLKPYPKREIPTEEISK